MNKILRIICAVLSAICLAGILPIGIFFDLTGVLSCILGAGIFYVLTLYFKQKQESEERKLSQTLDENRQEHKEQ